MPEEMVGGVEDLVSLLKAKQLQAPQENLQSFLGGEREGTQTDDGTLQRLHPSIVNKIAYVHRRMAKNDPNRPALGAILDQLNRILGDSQRDRDNDFGKAVAKNKRHPRLPTALDSTRSLKTLGFE